MRIRYDCAVPPIPPGAASVLPTNRASTTLTSLDPANKLSGAGFSWHPVASKASEKTTGQTRRSMKRLFVLALVATLAPVLLAATPPATTAHRYPTVPLHATYTVETNKLGQVVRVRSAQASADTAFNQMTRGNALQAFIRRPNGTAVAGVYQLIYDYSPKTKMVRRNVRLVHAGGVNPNAKGAVTVELENHAQRPQIAHPVQPAPQKSASLPDFDKIVK